MTPPQLYPDATWQMGPELELWVETDDTPITVRLKGALDGQIGANVRGVIEELLAEGCNSMAIDVQELEFPVMAGLCELAAIEDVVRQAGGTLRWLSRSLDTPVRSHVEAVGMSERGDDRMVTSTSVINKKTRSA
jgi:anti-anti-sigma regulatory factor